jgi:hypothetical protein
LRKLNDNNSGSAAIAAMIVLVLILLAGGYYMLLYAPAHSAGNGNTTIPGTTDANVIGYIAVPPITVSQIYSYIGDTPHYQNAFLLSGAITYTFNSSAPAIIANSCSSSAVQDLKLYIVITAPSGATVSKLITFSSSDVLAVGHSMVIHAGYFAITETGQYSVNTQFWELTSGAWFKNCDWHHTVTVS